MEKTLDHKFSIPSTIGWMLLLPLNPIYTTIAVACWLGLAAFYPDSAPGFEFFIKTAESEFIDFSILLITVLWLSKRLTKQNSFNEAKNFVGIKAIKLSTLVFIVIAGYSLLYADLWIEHLTDYVSYFDLDFSASNKELPYEHSVILFVITSCIIAPIAEELIFRGVIYQRLRASGLNIHLVILITSIVFCLFHFHYGWGLLTLMPYALFWGYMRYKTGNVIYPIISHIQFNIYATLYIPNLSVG